MAPPEKIYKLPIVGPPQPGDSPAGGCHLKLADALERLNRAQTTDAAGEVLRASAAEYGYDHLNLARSFRGATTDVPWNWMPSEFAEVYFTQGWEKHDPELYYAQRTHFPFSWTSLPQKMRMTNRQRGVIEAASSFGLQEGLCVPLPGTGGKLDTISLVSSHKRQDFDPAHRNATAFLALRALARYVELEKETETGCHPRTELGPFCELDDLINGPFAPFTLPPLHLRALVLVAIGSWRWRHGLNKLSSSLYLLRKCDPYNDLQRWGLIVDEPDDVRWRYYFTPSILGRSYLRRAPDTESIYREIWLRELDRREVPDGLEAE